MNEQILRSILELFAIAAKDDKVTHEERLHVENFLLEHINQSRVSEYMQFFDLRASQVVSLSDEEKLKEICSPINKNLTLAQKIVIFHHLLHIILADNVVSAHEQNLCRYLTDALNFPRDYFALIKEYLLCKPDSEINTNEILRIGETHKGASPFIERHGLEGNIFVLFIEEAKLYFFKRESKTPVFINGILQNNHVSRVLSSGTCIRWQHGVPVYSSDIMNAFKQLAVEKPITFDVKQIKYKFSDGALGLHDISFNEEGGKLIAVMGASGSGKSTLLQVLNGTGKPSSGQVMINGIDIYASPEKVEGVIGFVPQDDLLMEELTVWENIYFAARFCFSYLDKEAIEQKALAALHDVGLTHVKDLRVGSVMQKTLSGGQRKRLNVALELVREPSLLFLDEPTSGLSSRDSENMADLLKELSLHGKMIFVVIHQPSSDVFKLFDKLLILDTGGYPVYYGHPLEAILYFNHNIKLLNSDAAECVSCGNVNAEQIFDIIESKVVNEHGQVTEERRYSPQLWNSLYRKFEAKHEHTTEEKALYNKLQLPSWANQVWLFVRRDVLSKIKNKQYVAINLSIAPLLVFILAFIVRYSTNGQYDFSENPNIPVYMFMLVIVSLFIGLTVSAEEIFRDRKILKREKFLHLSRSAYLTSKMLILFSISAIQTALLVWIGNNILEIEGMTWYYGLILFSSACFANVLGLNISSMFNSAVTIYIMIPILLIPQLILSGVVIKFDELNPSLNRSTAVPLAGNVMASRWALEALMVTQYKRNSFEKEFYALDKTMGEAEYKRIYLLPELETHFSSTQTFLQQNKQTEAQQELSILANEMKKAYNEAGQQATLANVTFLATNFTKEEGEIKQRLRLLKNYYTILFNKKSAERENKVTQLTNTPEKLQAFETWKRRYQNEAVEAAVKNIQETKRIVRVDDHYEQKLFPIYKSSDYKGWIEWNAVFYMPAKKFMGMLLDTFLFNGIMLWCMTFVLMFTLQVDGFKKLLYLPARLFSIGKESRRN